MPRSDEPQDRAAAGGRLPSNPIIQTLASLRFALPVLASIAVACVAGTLLPQGSQVAGYMAKHPDAQGRMRVLEALGLTHVFYAWWFTGLLGLLMASLAVCTYRRGVTLRTVASSARLRIAGSLVTHISLLLVFFGAVLRAVWGEKGAIEFREGESVSRFQSHHGSVELPFAVRLEKFEIEFYQNRHPAAPASDVLLVGWPGSDITNFLPVRTDGEYAVPAPYTDGTGTNAYRVAIRRYVPDFVIDNQTRKVTSRSDQPDNPAVLVAVGQEASTNEQWVFARYPGFNKRVNGDAKEPPFTLTLISESRPPSQGMRDIKSFTSTLQIMKEGSVVLERQVRVNSPLSYGGYTLYQSGYNPRDSRWTSLQIVKDPGVPFVYGGGMLMMVGLALVFCIHPPPDSRRGGTEDRAPRVPS